MPCAFESNISTFACIPIRTSRPEWWIISLLFARACFLTVNQFTGIDRCRFSPLFIHSQSWDAIIQFERSIVTIARWPYIVFCRMVRCKARKFRKIVRMVYSDSLSDE
jgi:hypothetical protein